tara:strand:- start:1557 stop:2291 length:735 start_codon:yes stop_codon:yes gene_type:complete
MAVNIDTVYQRVLALANKEQRGYITPQEFNLHANQAQMNIFEQYFYDIHQFQATSKGNSTTYSDMVSILEEKISLFEKYGEDLASNNSNLGQLPTDLYRLGQLQFGNSFEDSVVIERVNTNEINLLLNSNLTAPTLERPVYVRAANSATLTIEIYPTTMAASNRMDNVSVNYIKKPTKAEWAYVVVNEKALFNSNLAVDFELHASEEESLVINILELAGITINKVGLVQVASNMEAKNQQQEKQ